MYSLKMLGLVILAGICGIAFILGYSHFQNLTDAEKAREEAFSLHRKIEDVITHGENEIVKVKIPQEYTIKFEEKRLVCEDMKFPENGYRIDVEGPYLVAGEYELLVSMARVPAENWKVQIRVL